MKPLKEKPNDRLANIFALVFGAFLGLALLKFGNPCILEKLVDAFVSRTEAGVWH